MSVRFFYVDESYNANKFCLSAISIRHTDWKESFDLVKQHRKYLKDTYGVFLRKEIHAQDLIRGAGRISSKPIGKWQRSRIFLSMLHLVAHLPNIWLFNICLDSNRHKDPQLTAWDRLMNRVERTMKEMELKEHPLRRGLIRSIHTDTEASITETIKARLMIFRSRASEFPEIESMTIDIKEWSNSSDPVSQAHYSGLPNRFYDCHNRRCYGGGVNLESTIREMVANKTKLFNKTMECIGGEGDKKRRLRVCLNAFEVKIEIVYKTYPQTTANE